MRFSFAIVLATVAALALSSSATPVDADAKDCPAFCWIDNNCSDCTWGLCVKISFLHRCGSGTAAEVLLLRNLGKPGKGMAAAHMQCTLALSPDRKSVRKERRRCIQRRGAINEKIEGVWKGHIKAKCPNPYIRLGPGCGNPVC
ncbi:uncharacterized protein EDB93DRAFT_1104095 [Suillus bovinus]|uniref:uncharacterized protein n=1 Tax=Suillus bovinus TaxID=48563 RepID=UPI001B877B89|nr:uncharacterized protein EDB93DRAFT_1104095 [Suillus bovinus]KAG2147418.1 hypothetical protein EDB93DRAFT_1104095 [Suillus bovinus]